MIKNCPGPEAFTGIAIPAVQGSQKVSASLAGAPGPAEFTGIKVPSILARAWTADVFVGPIPVVKTLVAMGAAGAGVLLAVQ